MGTEEEKEEEEKEEEEEEKEEDGSTVGSLKAEAGSVCVSVRVVACRWACSAAILSA